MGENTSAKPALPGNNGQFGEGDATERYEPLEDHASPADGEAAKGEPKGPQQTNAGERS